MSNWDLMMPGMGLTSIGLAGVVISYSGIAHTFIDGMHALTGLTMFIGLIFLAAGILQGGVSTSNKAKATVLVILSISLAFGTAGLIFNTISTVPLFAGIMMIIAVPAIVIAYVYTKMPAKSGTVLMVLNINPAVPNANDIESMTKTVAFALLLVDTPPCNIPAAKKISPMNMVSPVRACMPSMNV